MPELTFRSAIRLALKEELTRDPSVFLIGEDIGAEGGIFKVTEGLFEEFGEQRIRDTPISETAIIGCAIGAAIAGMRPVVELMFSDFSAVCMDQIVNQAAKLRYMSGGQMSVPVVIRGATGGGIGFGAQHSQNLESWFMHIPGIHVVTPSTAYDAKGLLKSAIRDNNPCMFFEHKMCYTTKSEVPDDEYLLPFGKADIKREGSDVTIVATMYMVHEALKAAQDLARDGIDCEIIDPRTLAPLDKNTILSSVKKTGKLVTVEENSRSCGWGAELASIIADEAIFDISAPVKRICNADVPIPFSPVLEKMALPDGRAIVKTVKKLMAE